MPINLAIASEQPILGPGQPFRLIATAFDPDALPLPMQYLWQQISGPGTAIFNDVTLLEPTVVGPMLGDYLFRLSATDGVAIVSSDITVEITNVYQATASYTATCPYGYKGPPVTEVATYLSSISPADAAAGALALATAEAEAALACLPNVAPDVRIVGLTPSVSALTTYTAACPPPDIGTPVTVSYTFTGVGRSYPAIESSSLTVAKATANKALHCRRGNLAPVIELIGFDFAVAATATATAQCSDLNASYKALRDSLLARGIILNDSPVSLSATVTLNNTTYQEAEETAYLTARSQALAAIVCPPNIPPEISISGWTATVKATVTAVSFCPWAQKGVPVLVVKSFSAYDYAYAEVTALTAAYAEGAAHLVCADNIPPQAFIVTEADLVYRCAVPYRNINYYRSAASVNLDFTYLATSTQAARCPSGTYGNGAYASATASSHISYADAEAKAIAAARAAAGAALSCTPYTGRIALRTFNANAKFAPGDSSVLGIFRLTSGTLSAPARLHFLGAYTLPATFQSRFTDNLFYLSQFNDVISGNWNYVFYLGRPHADGSYVWIADSVRLRLDSAYPVSAAAIASLTPAPTAGILSASEGVLSVRGLESLNNVFLSIAEAPYLALDPAGWCESGASYDGIYVLQTDPAVSTVLASGLLNLKAYAPDAYTEKNVVPLPFAPVITDRLSPLTFLFYFATGTTLNAGWPVGPPNATAPFAATDVSAVAWTNAGASSLSPYTVGSLSSAKTISGLTLPAASSHIATFAQTQDVKVILRRYCQRLF